MSRRFRSAAMADDAARTFNEGRYQVVRELGRGGMGVVFACRDTRLGRTVAIKILPDGLALTVDAQRLFLSEAQALAGLDHPNLVHVYDVGEEPIDGRNTPYLIMEYVDGDPLDQLLARQPMSLGDRLRRMAEVADAIDYCHARGIIHRDVKPGNVLISKDGQAKLIDFGLARSLAALTQRTTQIRGTPAYMAPEQITGGQMTAATDLYAFGASLYEVICGQLPFTEGEILFQHVYKDPLPPSRHAPGISPQLDAVVLCCLAKEPTARPDSAAELSEALRWLADRCADIQPTKGDSGTLRLSAKSQRLLLPRKPLRALRLRRWLPLGLLLVGLIGLGVVLRPLLFPAPSASPAPPVLSPPVLSPPVLSPPVLSPPVLSPPVDLGSRPTAERLGVPPLRPDPPEPAAALPVPPRRPPSASARPIAASEPALPPPSEPAADRYEPALPSPPDLAAPSPPPPRAIRPDAGTRAPAAVPPPIVSPPPAAVPPPPLSF